jgi:transcriptional regulator PpsR
MVRTLSPGEGTVSFRSPERYFGDLDPATAADILTSAADIALVVDRGVIKDISLGNEDLTKEGYGSSWRDKPWIETVTVESRPKIEDLLQLAPSSRGRWRQVNHPSVGGLDVPIRYTAVRPGGGDRIFALGRDLRPISLLQQRLLEAHQNLERDYSRLRQAEARYKLLFQSVSQPVLVVDPATFEIEEVNPAAANALGETVPALVGTSLESSFARESQQNVARSVSETLSVGNAEATNVRMKNGRLCDIATSAFRQDDATRVIVRLKIESSETSELGGASQSQILGVLEELPDGLVVAGGDLRILAANRAFVEMAHLISKGQMVGGRLADYLGRSPTDLNVLISNLKNHGVVRNFTTVLRDRFGNEEQVEVSAVAAPLQETAAYGFSVRGVARRLRTGSRISQELPSSADQLTGLVGRVPLKEIVRESTDLIEKLCIEAALQITDDNRASAAGMLGLSRQGLYSKLKRFGMDDSP